MSLICILFKLKKINKENLRQFYQVNVFKPPSSYSQIESGRFVEIRFVQRHHPVAEVSPEAVEFLEAEMRLRLLVVEVYDVRIVLAEEDWVVNFLALNSVPVRNDFKLSYK